MKASRLQIIFISDNPQLVNSGLGVGSPMSPEELAMYTAIEDARSLVQPSTTVNIQLFYLNKYKGNDLPLLEQWKINRYPAIRVWAEYPDGNQAWYNLNQGVLPETYSGEEIAEYVTGLLDGDFGQSSIVCKIFPPLCSLGGWVWLAAAAYTSYRAIDSQQAGKIAWGGAALLSWDAFFAGGGFKKLGIGQ